MSRIDDLIDLIQTTNDVFLINPSMNVRTAYIQIDDLCELSMKSYLQQHVNNWSPTKANGNYKTFHSIINEVKNIHNSNVSLLSVLDRIQSRRDNRNHFFHDHNQTGLTVSEKNCLDAFLDLYRLNEEMFGNNFTKIVNTQPLIMTQISIIRLKHMSYSAGFVNNIYHEFIDGLINLQLTPTSFGFEFFHLRNNPREYNRKFLSILEDRIDEYKKEIDRINSLKVRNKNHRLNISQLQSQIDMYKEIKNKCF